MKKVIVFLLIAIFALGLAGCTVPEPSVTPDPENENVWLCDGVVPKPDQIHVYRNGERNEDLTEEEFQAIWSAVNQIFNAKWFESILIDSATTPEDCETFKETRFCMEFLYDDTYRTELSSSGPFRTIFFNLEEPTQDAKISSFVYFEQDENGEVRDRLYPDGFRTGEEIPTYRALTDAILSALGQE